MTQNAAGNQDQAQSSDSTRTGSRNPLHYLPRSKQGWLKLVGGVALTLLAGSYGIRYFMSAPATTPPQNQVTNNQPQQTQQPQNTQVPATQAPALPAVAPGVSANLPAGELGELFLDVQTLVEQGKAKLRVDLSQPPYMVEISADWLSPGQVQRITELAEQQLNRPAGRNRKVTKLKTILLRTSADGTRFDRLFVKVDGTQEVTTNGTTTTEPLAPAGKSAGVTLGVNDLTDTRAKTDEWIAQIRFQMREEFGQIDRGGISRDPVTSPEDPLQIVND